MRSLTGICSVMCLLVFTYPAQASLESITATGSRYKVFIDDQMISEHNTEYKAIESALAYLDHNCFDYKCVARIERNLTLLIEFEGAVIDTERPVNLSWDRPVERENGSVLAADEIEAYVIEHDNLGVIESYTVGGDELNMSLRITKGLHRFRIATLDTEGVLGGYSQWVELNL